MKLRYLLVLASTACALSSYAQAERFIQDVEYGIEGSVTGATGEYAPLWLSANRYGLSSIENNSGYLRADIERRIENDSTQHWKLGYGLDIAVPYNYTSQIVLQQLYAEAQYKKVRLGVGIKERDVEFKNDALSTGGMTFSRNARPIPQVRAELADWWNITGHAHLLSIKGHIAYGMLTDGGWQEDFCTAEGRKNLYAKNILYHSKAGYFKFGDERYFPLTGMFGLEMVGEFGGEGWNIKDRGGTGNDDFDSHQQFSHGLRDFWDAFLPGGSDVNDGAFANVAGNQLGSWTFSLDWNTPEWGVRAYMDHFFEDHSQMFFQYGWKDKIIGVEGRLPKNPFVSEIVYENINTTDQSGSVYHDATSVFPIQLSGKDTYYNHHLYGAYQHWGQVLGNPLLLSPIYNHNGMLRLYHSRIRAHHIGLTGHPSDDISWRLLFTHQRSLGTHDFYIEDNKAVHILAEASYTPHQLQGWKFTLAFGSTSGHLMGNSQGMQATVTKTGIIQRRKKK